MRDLRAGYGDVPVVHGVSVSVGAGEVVAVIGPNGAGKTTLGKAVAGLLPSHGGHVVLDGEEITNIAIDRARARGLGYALEGRRLFPNMSVEDNLRAGGHQLRGRRALRDGCSRMFEMFPVLLAKRRHSAGSLSGGEAQMLALARTLMSPPRALILDEPTLGLAPLVVARVRSVISEIAGTGVAVLLIEQNATLTQAVSGYTHVMRGGRFVLAGASSALSSEAIHEAYMGDRLAVGVSPT